MSSSKFPLLWCYSLTQADFVSRFGDGLNAGDIDLLRRPISSVRRFIADRRVTKAHRIQSSDQGCDDSF